MVNTMELKQKDIIQFQSSDERYNGFFLVLEISTTEIKVQKPPDETYTLDIEDGKIKEVDEVVLVHSAHYPGYAEIHGFLPETKVTISFTFISEPISGVIQSLEKDMIEVKLEDSTIIYIDFEYVGPPSTIIWITAGEEIVEVDYEESDYILSESKSRFTIERQVNDLMDHLLTGKQTSDSIRFANLVTQRFKELRTLFSTPELDPYRHKLVPTPYTFDWIVPVTSVQRKVYKDISDTESNIENIEYIQNTSDSYTNVYKRILEELQPFFNKPTGERIQETIMTLLPSGHICVPTDKHFVVGKIKSVPWIPQVLTKPYERLHTNPEIVSFDSFFVLSYLSYASQTKSNSLPLLDKINFHDIYTHARVQPTNKKYDAVDECIPPTEVIINHTKYYSMHQCLQKIGNYEIYINDLLPPRAKQMQETIVRKIKEYKKPRVPEYKPNPLHEKDGVSSSEWQVELLKEDNGRLYAFQQATTFEVDTKHTLDKHIESVVDTKKTVSPPVVKIYKTIESLKADNNKIIMCDEELVKVDYDSMAVYTTIPEMMKYLVQVKKISPKLASLYAPYYIKGKKRVVDGDYAKVNQQYFKRVSEQWKLDETCSGPYPCTSNEPECEDDCVDVSERQKQNTMKLILDSYHLHNYTEKADRDSFLKESIDTSTIQLKQMRQLNKRLQRKYTDKYTKSPVVTITNSPHYSLLHFILQKPFRERYTELKQFIRTYTRTATKIEESVEWYYCVDSDIKIVPFLFKTLIEAFESNTYADVLATLERDGHLKTDNGLLVTKEGGFVVQSIESADSFDDMVRSTEVEDLFLDLPRDVHPNTQLVVELLSEACNVIKTNISNYFNYMIHEIVNEKNLILQSVCFVLKVASIIRQVNMNDYIPAMIKHKRFKTIVTRFQGEEEEELTEKSILYEIQTISSKYGVQIMTTKRKREKHSIQLWDTFLPPVNIKPRKNMSPSLHIMYTLQERVKHAHPLSESLHVNTWKGKVMDAEIEAVVSSIPTQRYLSYTIDKPFVYQPEVPPLLDRKIVDQHVMLEPEQIAPLIEEFQDKIPELTRSLRGIIPKDMMKPSMSMSYLKSFIQTIARVIPSYLMHESYEGEYDIPPSLTSILSAQHAVKLNTYMKKYYFKELKHTFKDTKNFHFKALLKDEEIHEIVDSLSRPCKDQYQYEYYIYFILKKYLDYGEDAIRTKQLIQVLIKSFINEYNACFLTYEEIQRKTLKDKTSESNRKRILLNGMETDKRYVSLFMESNNLDKKAQLGRRRDYTAERYDMNDIIESNDATDVDFGDDGYDHNDNDGE